MTYLNFNGDKFFNMPDGTIPSGNTSYTFVFKHGSVGATSGFLGCGLAQSNQTNSVRTDGNNYLNYWWGNDFRAGSVASGNVVSFAYDGSARSLFVNGVSAGTSANSSRATGTGSNTLGRTVNNEFLNGELKSMFIMQSSLSPTDRVAAEAAAAAGP